MKVDFDGRAVWVASLHKLVDAGIHFACIGTVCVNGRKLYIVQGYHDMHQRLLSEYDFELGIDWLPVPEA